MRKGPVAAVLSAMVSLTSCDSRIGLQDLYDPAVLGICSDRYRAFTCAPIVLVGTVTEVNSVGRPTPARRSPQILLQLTKVRAHVENVLRGGIVDRDVQFYYFGYANENHGYRGPPRFHVSPGERRVFFLTRELGHLRSVGDVVDYTLFVASGSHAQFKQMPESSIGYSIASVMLSLGERYSSSEMGASLPLTCPVSDHLTSRKNTVDLLKLLMQSPDKDLATSACLYLAANYGGQHRCLAEVLASSATDSIVRSQAERIAKDCWRRTEYLRRSLQRFPLQAFSDIPVPDSLQAIREELELLLDDPDEQIRGLACDALRRSYPEPEAACAQQVSARRAHE